MTQRRSPGANFTLPLVPLRGGVPIDRAPPSRQAGCAHGRSRHRSSPHRPDWTPGSWDPIGLHVSWKARRRSNDASKAGSPSSFDRQKTLSVHAGGGPARVALALTPTPVPTPQPQTGGIDPIDPSACGKQPPFDRRLRLARRRRRSGAINTRPWPHQEQQPQQGPPLGPPLKGGGSSSSRPGGGARS